MMMMMLLIMMSMMIMMMIKRIPTHIEKRMDLDLLDLLGSLDEREKGRLKIC